MCDPADPEIEPPPGEPAADATDRGPEACEDAIDPAVRAWEERRREVRERLDRGELELMIAQLMDDDENARYEAARDIAKGGPSVLPRAIELAEDPRPRMREMACYILGQVGDPDPESPELLIRYPDGLPTLVCHLEHDPDEEVRSTAAHALGFLQLPASLPALCVAALSPSVEIRYAAAHGLGSFYEEVWEDPEAAPLRAEVIRTLLRLMDDEDEDVRDWATFAIHQGRHDTPEVRARLWKVLDDSHPEVRGEAACALAIFGDRSLIPRLERLLREDPLVTTHFFEAAEELGDPCLLPAVLVGADRWRAEMKEGEEMSFWITSAIEALQAIETPRS
jgi:HEAT repeat protein